MWNAEAVKAYESGQGVVLVEKPYPHYEPVGQLQEDAFGRGQVMWFNKPADQSMLYTTPPLCPTCEALAQTVMLDQTSHDTTPPQRTWVGLTDEDRFELAKAQLSWEDLLIAAEAKLKEKNF